MHVVGLVVRVLCVFALLGATIWVLSRMDGRAGKTGLGKRKRERAVQVTVTASARLSKGASVSVVRVGDTDYVLGVTENAVNLLSTTVATDPPKAPDTADNAAAGVAAAKAAVTRPDFAALLKARLTRTTAAPSAPQAGETAMVPPPAAPLTPPTTAEFLGNSWRVARGKTLASTDVSAVAVRAALAAVMPSPNTIPSSRTASPPQRRGRIRGPPHPRSRGEHGRTNGSGAPVVTARLDVAAKRGGVRRDLIRKTVVIGLFVLGALLLGAGRSSAQTVPTPVTTIAPVAPVTTSAPTTTPSTQTPGDELSQLISPTTTPQGTATGGALSNPISLVLLIGALSVVPALLITITAFTRIVVVLGLTRSALGTNGVPPTQVLIGLSLFLTLFVMAPQISQANKDAVQPFLKGEISQSQAFDKGMEPFREFMLKNVREKDLSLFVDLSKEERPAKPEDVPTTTLVPAFVISELRTAFLIGFVIFLPFIVIDLVVSAALSALGMAMLPPSLVSLPFKLLLFVAVDGWYLLASSLVRSFH